MFRHDWHPGRPFLSAGTPGFPYLEVECLQLQLTEELQEQRSTYSLLKSNDNIKAALDAMVFANNQNKSLMNDLKWRAMHLGQTLGFWEIVANDIPLQLTSSIGMAGSSVSETLTVGDWKCEGDPSVLPKFRQFEKSHLVQYPFRCFHRSDGL